MLAPFFAACLVISQALAILSAGSSPQRICRTARVVVIWRNYTLLGAAFGQIWKSAEFLLLLVELDNGGVGDIVVGDVVYHVIRFRDVGDNDDVEYGR